MRKPGVVLKPIVNSLDELSLMCSDMMFRINDKLWVHKDNYEKYVQNLEQRLEWQRNISKELSSEIERLKNTCLGNCK